MPCSSYLLFTSPVPCVPPPKNAALQFWDWVCGTDDAYNKWRAEKRPDLLAARRQAAAAAGN